MGSDVRVRRCPATPVAEDVGSLDRRLAERVLDQRVALDRAAHAPGTATAGAQLRAGDAHDLDAGLLEPGVRLVVALVRHGDPGREREARSRLATQQVTLR